MVNLVSINPLQLLETMNNDRVSNVFYTYVRE